MIHVVVVEDDRDIAFLLTHQLKKKFAIDALHVPRVHRATDETFWTYPGDKVVGLIDLMLPGTSGVDIARELREKIDGDLRLIALTAAGEHSYIYLEAEESGFFDHMLTKPVSYEELIRAIHGDTE